MITQQQFEELAKADAADHHFLTVYLNVDQSQSVNLNRGFETDLRNKLREEEQSLEDPEERAKFQIDSAMVYEFLKVHEVSERGLLVVADSTEGRLNSYSMETPVDTQVLWGPVTCVRPLAELMDEYQPYAVVVCTREEARLLVIGMGGLAARSCTDADKDVHRFDATSRDTIFSQMHFQRKQDLHVKHHMKSVADALDNLFQQTPFARIILAGPDEVVAELKGVMPDTLRKMVIGETAIAAFTSDGDILKLTRPIAEQWERQREMDLVDELTTAAGKGQGAVTGLDDTFESAMSARVRTLVYAQGLPIEEFRRERLRSRFREIGPTIFGAAAGDGAISGDVLDWMVQAVVRQGGTIEQLRGPAADRFLAEAGGVGALVRY